MKKIFILPGWAYENKNWNDFLSLLRQKGFQPILLPIPGLSEKIEKPWDISDYVSWLDRKLKYENDVLLLGHSNGGRIALSYIIKFPRRVKKLILIDSAGIYHKELLLRVKRVLFKSLAKMGKKVTKSEKLKDLLYKFAKVSDYNQAPSIMKATMKNLIAHDLTPNLNNIKTKTLIIWGENDTTTPLSDGKLFKEKLKNSSLEIIKEARHSPQFTHSKMVLEIIEKFI